MAPCLSRWCCLGLRFHGAMTRRQRSDPPTHPPTHPPTPPTPTHAYAPPRVTHTHTRTHTHTHTHARTAVLCQEHGAVWGACGRAERRGGQVRGCVCVWLCVLLGLCVCAAVAVCARLCASVALCARLLACRALWLTATPRADAPAPSPRTLVCCCVRASRLPCSGRAACAQPGCCAARGVAAVCGRALHVLQPADPRRCRGRGGAGRWAAWLAAAPRPPELVHACVVGERARACVCVCVWCRARGALPH
jgi:hypothetical protein